MHVLRHLVTYDPNSVRRVSPNTVLWEADEEDSVASDMDEALDAGIPVHAVDVVQQLDQAWFGVPPSSKPRARSAARGAPIADDSAHGPADGPSTPKAAALPSAALPAGPSKAGTETSSSGGLRRLLSAPVPTSLPKQTDPTAGPLLEAGAAQGSPGFGTWAARQRLFGRQPGLLQHSPGSSGPASPPQLPLPLPHQHLTDAELAANPFLALYGLPAAAAAKDAAPPAASSVSKSEQDREAAWRWRFSRKWAAEQKRRGQGGGAAARTPSVGSLDGLEALQFTQACGVGVNLQLGTPIHRTASLLSDQGTLTRQPSCQFDVSAHGSCQASEALAAGLLSPPDNSQPFRQQAQQSQQAQQAARSSSATEPGSSSSSRRRGLAPWLNQEDESPLRRVSATSAVLSMANKAQDLLQKQQEIEQEAQSRWERSMSAGLEDAWAGQHLPPVQIKMSGRFRYVVLRAVDVKGRQRYLVRGGGGSTPAELLTEVEREAAAICRRAGLPQLNIKMVGNGVMEWREDTDRHLHLSAAGSSGDAISPKKGGNATGNVTGLAASLVRQALPIHFTVSTSLDPSRLASTMGTLRL